jgi:hypothetical protein
LENIHDDIIEFHTAIKLHPLSTGVAHDNTDLLAMSINAEDEPK